MRALVSAVDDDDTLQMLDALLHDAGYQILEKPFQPPRLLAQIETALKR